MNDDFMAAMVGAAQSQDAKLAKKGPKKAKKSKRSRDKAEEEEKGGAKGVVEGASVNAEPKANKKSKKCQEKKGPNSLRNAIKNSNSKGETLTSSQRKANELWFRKANYGEILFKAYYKGQSDGVIVGSRDNEGGQGLSKKEKKRRRKREEVEVRGNWAEGKRTTRHEAMRGY
jgi:hypothetical protein